MAESESPESSRISSTLGSIVRAGLSVAPFAGSIASLWADWDSSRRFARVETAIQQLAQALQELGNRFDAANLGEPEMHLLEDVVRRISREHRENKRKQFVNLIASHWIYTSWSFDERLLFNRALDRLDEPHIKILTFLREHHNVGREAIHTNDLYREVFGGRVDEEFKFGIFIPAMVLLATELGFVRRRGEEKGKVMVGVNPDGLQLHAICSIFPVGIRFLDSIELRLPEQP